MGTGLRLNECAFAVHPSRHCPFHRRAIGRAQIARRLQEIKPDRHRPGRVSSPQWRRPRGDTGDRPLQKIRWGDRGAIIPQYLENVITN